MIYTINDYLYENKKYLLLFDDANKVAQFEYALDECFNLKKPAQVKALITIRDYAKKQVTLEVKKYSSTNEVALGQLKDGEIKSILKDNYNIQNHEFLNKICQVSKGNARLAVLAGLRSIESGLPAINNAEDIFKSYYDPIIDKVGIDKNELILLGIIAFFSAVRTKENEFYSNLIEKYLGDNYSINSIERLYDLELIDWFEKEIVRIADQSLGNYILYLVIYNWLINHHSILIAFSICCLPLLKMIL